MKDLDQEEDMQNKKEQFSLIKIFIKSILLSFVFVILFLIITAMVYGFILFSKYKLFLSSANISHQQLVEIIKQGIYSQPIQASNHKNILVLGLDTVENRQDMPVLTDTMMLFSIDFNSGKIKSLSLPRDIYNLDYQTKINALLHYGTERYPENPVKFPVEVISEMTNLPIQHALVLSLADLEKIINILDGIEIDVPESFVDTEFPRSDVDITIEKDPKKLYETVIFQKGTEVMTGERALKYIRSRHSESDQGTDIARGKRQQQVIASIFAKLTNPKFIINNPKILGELLNFYNKNFSKYISLKEMISTAKALVPFRSSIEFENLSLSIYPEVDTGALYNPPTWKNGGQWVYQIKDETEFKKEVQNLIN